MFALLVHLEGITLVETCGLYAIPPIKQLALLELRQEIAPGSDVLTPAQIAEHEEDLRIAYFDVTDSLASPQMPELRNTDGDALVLQQLVFDIESPQAAFDALAHLDITGSRDLETAERGSAGELCRVQLTWSRHGNPVHKEWENTILASIEISGSRMTANVNSDERAAEFRRIVEQALGSRARYRISEVQSADKLAAVAQAAPAGAHGVDPELLESPELKARIMEFIERHYESWVEQEIPALGGLTPLAAVREPGGPREGGGAAAPGGARQPKNASASGSCDVSAAATAAGAVAELSAALHGQVEEQGAARRPGRPAARLQPVRHQHIRRSARLEVAHIAGDQRQAVQRGNGRLQCVGQFPALGSAQRSGKIGDLGGERKRGEGIEQLARQTFSVVGEFGQHFGAGDDGNGTDAAVLAEEGCCRLDSVEMVDQDDGIQQVLQAGRSHSSRIRCCHSNPSP